MNAKKTGSKLSIAMLSMIAAQQAWASTPASVNLQTQYSITADQLLSAYQGTRTPLLKPVVAAQPAAGAALTADQLTQISSALAKQLPRNPKPDTRALAIRSSAMQRLNAAYPDARLQVNYTRADGSSGFVSGLEKVQPAAFSLAGGTPPDIKSRARAGMQDVAELFGIANPQQELKIADMAKDKLGFKHIRLQQTHNGYPVFGRSLILHADQDDALYLSIYRRVLRL